MINKCVGCGVFLQNENPDSLGFVSNKESTLCNRCFRLRHYNEYAKVVQNNEDYISILKKIDASNDLVVLVVDMFLFHKDIVEISKYIHNDILLVLTKRDVLPKRIDDQKWISYFQSMPFSFVDIEVVSSLKNYHFDSLFTKINTYKKSEKVYVIGYTNAGKSTLINKIIYHYSNEKALLTTSMMPSTTLGMVSVPISSTLTLIDTPGLLISHSFMEYADDKMLKKILPKKEIKPITYQVKGKQYIEVEDFLTMEIENANITLYFSNQLSIKRFYKKKNTYDYTKKIVVKKGEELVLEGLGFITVSSTTTFIINIKYDILVYTRKKII